MKTIFEGEIRTISEVFDLMPGRVAVEIVWSITDENVDIEKLHEVCRGKRVRVTVEGIEA